MDAVKFIKERQRMCKSFSPDCEGRRIDEVKPVVSECVLWALDNPDKVVKIVEEWSAAHPRKTRQSVFLEHYPDARIDSQGVLCICPADTHGDDSCPKNGSPNNMLCGDCRREFWMQEVE